MAATSATLMAVAMGTQAVASYQSAEAQASSIRTQAKFTAQQAETNAKIAERQAEDAISEGDQRANAIRRQASQIKGAQKAAFAGQGVNINAGSPLDIADETTVNSEIDMMTARNNAWREAWGYRVQANDINTQAGFQSLASRNEARQTMIAGGMSAINYGVQAGYYGVKAYEEGKLAKKADTKSTKADLTMDKSKSPSGKSITGR